MEGVIALCFWTFETSTIELAVQDNVEVTPRGVAYTLRSVLRGCIVPSLAHFTDVLYTPKWVFLCLFTAKAVEGLECQTGRCKHPRFLYVVINK